MTRTISAGNDRRRQCNTTIRPIWPLFLVMLLVLFGSGSEAAQRSSGPAQRVDGLQGLPSRMLRPLGAVEATYREQTITEDTVWRGVVVLEGAVTVAPQATLTIMPGAVVVAKSTDAGGLGGTSLFVQGRLVAQGDADRPVLFTSVFAAPQPGDWYGVILQGSEKKNQLDNCRIEGAERGVESHYSSFSAAGIAIAHCRIGLRLLDSLTSIRGITVSDSPTGVMIQSGETDLRDGVVSGGQTGIAAEAGSVILRQVTVQGAATGLVADGVRLQVRGAVFAGNGTGLSLVACEGEVVGTRVVDNQDEGVCLKRSRLKLHGNEISGNGRVGLRLGDDLAALWGNSIRNNGAVELAYDGAGDLSLPGNWWGGLSLSELNRKVVLGRVTDPPARVLLVPLLSAPPVLPF